MHHLNPSNELLAKLDARDLRGDGAVTIEVVSYDWNCPRYITPRFTAEAVDTITAPLHARIQELEAQLTQDLLPLWCPQGTGRSGPTPSNLQLQTETIDRR